MISIFLPAPLIAVLSFTALLTVMTAHFLALLPLVLIKAVIPHAGIRLALGDSVIRIADHWVNTNKILYRLFFPLEWDVDVSGELDRRKSYLLVCNHQSWLDIMVLFDLMHGKVPFPRFFLKEQLKYVPIIGLACWGMDFPFMKRHSKEAIAANPELAREDLESTRRACEIFRKRPATVVNFLEGTRFTEAKRVQRQSPYRNLLRPKAGGMSFALNTMGDQFAGLIDVTIAYEPTPFAILHSFLRGEQLRVQVHVNVRPLPQDMLAGDYVHDEAFRHSFQIWVNQLWTQKDGRLDRMQPRPRPQIYPAAN